MKKKSFDHVIELHKQKKGCILKKSGLILLAAVVLPAVFSSAVVAETKKDAFDIFSQEVVELIEQEGYRDLREGAAFQTRRIVVKATKELEDETAIACAGGYENLYVYQYASAAAAKEACEKFLVMPEVIFAQPDQVLQIQEEQSSEETPSFLAWGAQTIGIDRYQQFLKGQFEHLDQVVVAVVDTGLTASANEMFDGRVLNGINYCQDNRTASTTLPLESSEDYSDNNGHGTSVAGIIVESTLSNVKIMPVKSLNQNGEGTELEVYMGISYALKQGVDVINISCGAEGTSDLYESAMAEAQKQNVTVVAAAGNEHEDVEKETPGNIQSVLTIGSIDSQMKRSDFSNYGALLDFVAPGERLQAVNYKGGVRTVSGTSFSAPYMSAVAALLKTTNPLFTPQEIEEQVKTHIIDLGPVGRDDEYGYGMIDVSMMPEAMLSYIDCTPGDVDEDGEITVMDALLILKYLTKQTTLTLRQQAAAMVSGNKVISSEDALLLLRYMTGSVNSLS